MRDTVKLKVKSDETSLQEGISFNPSDMRLIGIYADQLSAYRAKKVWINEFEEKFLLEFAYDYTLKVAADHQQKKYLIECEFLSSCGKYAFWRLIHNQALDVQEAIENAHLPTITAQKGKMTSIIELEGDDVFDTNFFSDNSDNDESKSCSLKPASTTAFVNAESLYETHTPSVFDYSRFSEKRKWSRRLDTMNGKTAHHDRPGHLLQALFSNSLFVKLYRKIIDKAHRE
jgi:hypothetical protein